MPGLSRRGRPNGTIKGVPEDFIVEEIVESGTVLKVGTQISGAQIGMPEKPEGKFTLFVMEKSGWNTAQALREVASKVQRGIKSVGFAGTKDRMSISTQLCSIFGAEPSQISGVRIKDIRINGAWKYDSKMELGSLAGNHFTIKIRDTENDKIIEIERELGGVFPNYFGEQRFGSRKNNFDVGLDIIKGDFESAVMRFLTDTNNEQNQEAVEARKRLASEQDFRSALAYYPNYLKYERSMLDYLARYPKNFANAIRKLPRQISLLMAHSVEDQIFNLELEALIKLGHTHPSKGDLVCASDLIKFYDTSKAYPYESGEAFMLGNILGYQTEVPTEFEKEQLEKLGLTLDSFKVKGLSELNCKGSKRVLFAPYRNFSAAPEGDTSTVSFSLPAGCYATTLLDELINRGDTNSI